MKGVDKPAEPEPDFSAGKNQAQLFSGKTVSKMQHPIKLLSLKISLVRQYI